jgi:malate dehydrogenase (oxaloacetate-decarboxylating)(NADP+)
MKMAAALALAELAREEVPQSVNDAVGRTLVFGAEYVIPTPFDPRLIGQICPAVAKASMDSGNAKIQIADLAQYKVDLMKKFSNGN